MGIIGIIAALTIPGLVQNTQKREYYSAYKKAYSAGANAFERQVADFAYVKLVSDSDPSANPKKNFIAFKSYFNVIKDCTNSSGHAECWDDSGEMIFSTMPHATAAAFVDASGTAWVMAYLNSDVILIDTNGTKGPNHYGKDRWMLMPADEDGNRACFTYKTAVTLKQHAGDYTSYNPGYCQHPPCYYNSAIMK